MLPLKEPDNLNTFTIDQLNVLQNYLVTCFSNIT